MRNPPWQKDEIILVMDFYMDNFERIPGKDSSEIRELSELLNQFRNQNGLHGDEKFRNTNGVYMKIMNLRGLDERYEGKGLESSSKGDKEVWDRFYKRPDDLKSTANTIRGFISDRDEVLDLDTQVDDEVEQESSEGKVVTRKHKTYERNPKLVRKKKAKVLKEKGKLDCEVCGFNFTEKYGNRGEEFIECHHTKPVSEIGESGKTNIDDLALLCSNCHRMIHRKRPWISVDELKRLLQTVVLVK